MSQSTSLHSDTVQKERYEKAKARVTFQRYKVKWVLSEIRKIEAERELAGNNASLAETKNGKVKRESDANIVSQVVECERTDEQEMGDHNSGNLSTA